MSSKKPSRNLSPNKQNRSQSTVTGKLRRRFLAEKAQKILPIEMLAESKKKGELLAAAIADPDDLVEAGDDPLFALYASVQHLVSVWGELLLETPELRGLRKQIIKDQDEYQPSYPPISPITSAYFAMRMLCDMRIGGGSETIAGILADLGDLFDLSADYLALIRILAESRMGIYEHCGLKDGTIRLRELVTDKEFAFVGTSGYPGNTGELWLVRAVAPPDPAMPYWIGMGTPHVLRGFDQAGWLAFFARNGIRSGEVGFERRLDRFLKFGPEPRYWSEFIFEGYAGHNSGAIFLLGLPDVPESRPHSPSFDPASLISRQRRR